ADVDAVGLAAGVAAGVDDADGEVRQAAAGRRAGDRAAAGIEREPGRQRSARDRIRVGAVAAAGCHGLAIGGVLGAVRQGRRRQRDDVAADDERIGLTAGVVV